MKRSPALHTSWLFSYPKIDTMANFDTAEIAARRKAGKKITPEEYAHLIANSPEAFFAFLIANNPGSMNDILRNRLGYDFELQFKPDPAKITRICEMILERDNKQEIATILNNFKLQTAALSPQLLAAIQKAFNKAS
jgi:hypothetical protein